MTPATKNSCTWVADENAATNSSTMRPKISMGSMPDWPTDWALITAVTNASRTTATATTGPRPSAKQTTSAAEAAMRASTPAS